MPDSDESPPYSHGGYVPVSPTWISFPVEIRVLTVAEMERILDEMRDHPNEPLTFIDGRNY